MAELSRRNLLASGSLAMVAVGVTAALPAPAASAAPAAGTEPAQDGELRGPLIAHVTDVRRGLISLYVDDREVRVTDRELAARLYTASR